jgi:uncharacterized protein
MVVRHASNERSSLVKVTVVSDTHGNYPAAVRAVSATRPDVVIHLGDFCDDALMIESAVGIRVVSVPGNCDPDAVAPRKLTLEIGGVVFLICHGDRFYVKSGLRRLEEAAAAARASIVLFGHTHRPLCERRNGILFVNPGTLAESANELTFAVIDVGETGFSATVEALPAI